MKVFDIETVFNYGQTNSVVAENMAQAERIFLAKHKHVTILRIKLHSEYAQVQGIDEQAEDGE